MIVFQLLVYILIATISSVVMAKIFRYLKWGDADFIASLLGILWLATLPILLAIVTCFGFHFLITKLADSISVSVKRKDK
jgi:hypothetical protein